jgi:hypothetical protein
MGCQYLLRRGFEQFDGTKLASTTAVASNPGHLFFKRVLHGVSLSFSAPTDSLHCNVKSEDISR